MRLSLSAPAFVHASPVHLGQALSFRRLPPSSGRRTPVRTCRTPLRASLRPLHHTAGTYALILANAATFAAQHFSLITPTQFTTLHLHHAVWRARPWQLISSIFVHRSFIHLSATLFPLLIIGCFLEERADTATLLSAYLLAGVFANAFALYIAPTKFIISAGGAAGVLGLLVAAAPLGAAVSFRGAIEAAVWGAFVVGRVLVEGSQSIFSRKAVKTLVRDLHIARIGGAAFGGILVFLLLLLFSGWGEDSTGEFGRRRLWREFKRDWYYRGR